MNLSNPTHVINLSRPQFVHISFMSLWKFDAVFPKHDLQFFRKLLPGNFEVYCQTLKFLYIAMNHKRTQKRNFKLKFEKINPEAMTRVWKILTFVPILRALSPQRFFIFISRYSRMIDRHRLIAKFHRDCLCVSKEIE
jgi:hypothetical protein